MPITSQQLYEGFRAASDKVFSEFEPQSTGKLGTAAGEVQNALRDFRLDIDDGKVRNLSTEQLIDLAAEMLNLPKTGQNVIATALMNLDRGRTQKAREQVLQYFTPQALADFNKTALRELVDGTPGRSVDRFVGIMNSLESFGLLRTPLDAQIRSFTGSDFSAEAFVTAENKRLADEARALGQAPGGPARSSILPGGLDLSDFTPEQIADLEQAYLNAGNSPTLMDKVFSMQEITDDDIRAFYDEAKDFIAGPGSAMAQQFQRGKEAFELELDFQAKERERQLEMEKIRAAEAKRQAQAGLEAAGRTFSGEAVRQLGGVSAFRDEDIEGMIPEGILNQEERLMTSSSRARFDKAIQDFGRQTEEVLGAGTLAGIAIPKVGGEQIFTPTAGIRGSLERERETAIQTKAQELEQAEIERRQEILAAEGGVTTQ